MPSALPFSLYLPTVHIKATCHRVLTLAGFLIVPVHIQTTFPSTTVRERSILNHVHHIQEPCTLATPSKKSHVNVVDSAMYVLFPSFYDSGILVFVYLLMTFSSLVLRVPDGTNRSHRNLGTFFPSQNHLQRNHHSPGQDTQTH